ncbi:CHAD domain-containing protein [Arthrobacter sp. UYEF3]|uniref:CHAD domain-containing protein n=1 Tax=Arthrobacter sp. UYEF3 TaxID=1756365 RepID=UPI003391DF40
MATTAGQVLLVYLEEQISELRRHAPGVRARRPAEIHHMRVASRRLRSLLASGRPLFDDGAVDPVRAELRWLSEMLGAARDPGVVHDRLASLLAREPESLRFGPAAERIDEELNALAAAGFEAAIEALEGERFTDLLAALDKLFAGAPLSPKAAGAAGSTIRQLMAGDERRLRRTVAALPLPADDGGAARDAGLHEVRKAAKRLRYSAEFAEYAVLFPRGSGAGQTAGGKQHRRAKKTAAMAAKIQQLLGRHQDSVMARARLAELGGRALRSGENGFSYGRLHAREESLAADAERAFLKLWRKLPSS